MIDSPEVNAFVVPGGGVVVYTGKCVWGGGCQVLMLTVYPVLRAAASTFLFYTWPVDYVGQAWHALRRCILNASSF